jgi:hypothetical protein
MVSLIDAALRQMVKHRELFGGAWDPKGGTAATRRVDVPALPALKCSKAYFSY